MGDDYEVGYGRPPRHSRFKPGESGNPKGRPKEARNLATELELELKSGVTVREDGAARRVSKRKAVAKALVLKAMRGDTRAIAQVADMDERAEAATSSSSSDLTGDEVAILRRYGPRVLESLAPRQEEDDDAS